MLNKMVFTGFTLTDADIYSGVKYEHCINTGNELNLGVAAAAQLKFTVDNRANDAYKYLNQSFVYSLQQSNDVIFRTIGVFHVTKVEKKDHVAEITALDRLSYCLCISARRICLEDVEQGNRAERSA